MDRVALITGGARGIGRAIVEDMARDHRVAFTYFEGAEAAKAACAALPGVLAIRADFRDLATPARVVSETVARFGRLDVLVNNAGALHETPWDSGDPALYAELFAVNSTAPALMIQAAAPHMQSGGTVVNISSMNATKPPASAGAYAASKAALQALTISAARQFGPTGIRVNAVAPGCIERAEKPRDAATLALFRDAAALGRVGTPGDIVGPVRFLCSEAAGFITGTCLDVSGGFRL